MVNAPKRLAALRDARPAQVDVVARHLAARIRASLLGITADVVQIDRFFVLDRLGAGATGVVFAAFDPRLDRKIALKLMRASGDLERDRVLAEARAMARLSDPNVVAIYDASESAGELYIAMELVAGCNLRQWLAAQPRSVAEIVTVFAQAGRGLATAHAAGLIHGDVKPENILVGDGLVKVADFGLARADSAPAPRGGTRAYMAPEQLATGASALSDQYAFAASLYEAISGSRPSAPRTAPLDAPVRIARAVDRALLQDPAARYPSMSALLDALAPAAPRRRRGAWVLALAALAVAAALALRAGTADPCSSGDLRLAAVWPPAVRAKLPQLVARGLDDYGRRWAEMARATCEATQRGAQSPAMLDLRTSCLDRRLGELTTFIADVVKQPSGADVSAVFELSPIEPCADRDRLAGVLPPSAADRPAVAELRVRIDRDRARQETRESGAALDDIEQVVARARTLGYAPVLGEALLVRGRLQYRAGRFVAAAESFKDAAAAAGAGRDDDALVSAWTQLAHVLGTELPRASEALAYLDGAEALAVRAESPTLQRAEIRKATGGILEQTEHLAESRAALEQAVRLFEQARGELHPSVAAALSLLAHVCLRQDDLAAARKYAERARAILTTTVGPEQPEVALVLESLAATSDRERDLPRALAEYHETLELFRVLGDERGVATTRNNIAELLRRLGRVDEARAELEQALAIFERTTGLDNDIAISTLSSLAKVTPDPEEARRRLEDVLTRRIARFGAVHRSVADTLNDLGNQARDRGDLAAATTYYERALAGYEQALGATHPRVSVALSNLGEVALARRRFDDALRVCTRARALDEATLGPDHPDLAYDLACLGEAKLGLGDARGAVALLERAVAFAASAAPDDRARAQFALARALWDAGGDRLRARALATAAAPEARPVSQRAVIARWLAAH
jgi:eukaryotic-like serine/threonine-protein kinase